MVPPIPYKIILASGSPRRRELLAGLGLDFEVRLKKDIDESYPESLPVDQVAACIAHNKATAYEVSDDEILITADTVVVANLTPYKAVVLGKPKDADDARRMLRILSDKTHRVITGVCLTTKSNQRLFSVTTEVTFVELSKDEIDYYVDNFKPFDKAGAYGIQEWIGYIGVTRIRGSYFNVMGLPVQRIWEELSDMCSQPPMGDR